MLMNVQMVMDNFDGIFYMNGQEGDNEIAFIEDMKRGVTYVQVNGEECQADPLESRFVTYRRSLSYAKSLKEILNLDGDDFYFIGNVRATHSLIK